MGNRASSEVGTSPAPAHLTYLSSKSVIEHFSIGKRRELVKKIPSLRRINAKIPFHFDKVTLSYDNYTYRMKLDDVEWIMKSKETRCIGTVETVVNGRKTVKNERVIGTDVLQLMKVYLKGSGRIKELRIVKFPLFPKNAVIGYVEMQFWASNPLVDNLLNVQCNHVVLESLGETSDDLYDMLDVRQLQITETRTTLEKFRKMCWKLKEGNRLAGGSFYHAEYEGLLDEFWENLKEELHGETWYNDLFVANVADEKYKLLVTRKSGYRDRESNFLFRVEIVEIRIEDHLTADLWIFRNLDKKYHAQFLFALTFYPFIVWNYAPIIDYTLDIITTTILFKMEMNYFSVLFMILLLILTFINFYQDWTAQPRKSRVKLTISTVFLIFCIKAKVDEIRSLTPNIWTVLRSVYDEFRDLHQEWTAQPRKHWIELAIATVHTPANMIYNVYITLKIFMFLRFIIDYIGIILTFLNPF